MWIKGNYRRNLMDMHIDDWHEDFLSRLDPAAYVDALADAGVQAAMVKAKPHTGLCYWPSSIGRMHRGLKGRDFIGEMIELCHQKDIAVIVYFSQIFDNWAYENHPDWRLVAPDGKNFREYRGMGDFRSGRYGIVCPNHPGYRAYVRANLQELCSRYRFEGMFLDMTFWTEVCTCASCRQRYLEETGREVPRVMDWQDDAWQDFVYRRSQWMADFASESTRAIHEINPEITVEHQFSMITSNWVHGSTELLAEHSTYLGGDYYGGYLQQTFINKYYRSVSPRLPFVYHTGRCDPELAYHTTTKTSEQLALHAMTALLHDGAFLLVDAINPDGTFVPEVYHDLMKGVYADTRRYEPYAGGTMLTDAAIWFASHAKYDPEETGVGLMDKTWGNTIYMQAPIAMASVLREENIPFHVIGTKNIASYQGRAIALCHVAKIRDEEMDALEAYVQRGGSLYVSGPVGHPRLEKLLGVHVTGRTESAFTYMAPAEGSSELEGFSALAPLTVDRRQYTAEITAEDVATLATLTLPYVPAGGDRFAAIHSNPPGIHTKEPAITCRKVGGSTLIWAAAPIEVSQPYMTRRAVGRLMKRAIGTPSFTSDAPKFVEILHWAKEGHEYFAALNQQEESPVVPMRDITITVPGEGASAALLPEGTALETRSHDGVTDVLLPKVHLYAVMEIRRR